MTEHKGHTRRLGGACRRPSRSPRTCLLGWGRVAQEDEGERNEMMVERKEGRLTWNINGGTVEVASNEERSSQCRWQTRNEVTHLIYLGSTVTRDLPQGFSFLGFDSCHTVTPHQLFVRLLCTFTSFTNVPSSPFISRDCPQASSSSLIIHN